MSKKIIESHFKFPYCQTCYSLQGLDVDEPFTIFDINHYFVDMNWIYTAITRATEIKNINIFGGVLKYEPIEKRIFSMIDAHKRSDKKRDMPTFDYIDVEWVKEQLMKTRTCEFCQVEINDENFSVDRIDNNLNHIKNNCRIICRHCNCANH